MSNPPQFPPMETTDGKEQIAELIEAVLEEAREKIQRLETSR